MAAEWDRLPLLPLRCILDHLSVESALAATSSCRHWRQAMLLYEGRRETLTLRPKHIEKNLFLTRVFRRHIRKLHIHINCSEDQLNKFLTFVLPQYFDSKNLQEIVFIGPIYLQQNPAVPFTKLKRIITESLVFKQSSLMQKLAFLGCKMSYDKDDKDRFVHKQVEYYSKMLTFAGVTSPADAVLSRCNVDMMMFSTLKHIIFEYQLISTEALETLSQLNNLNLLTLNVIFKRHMTLPVVDWQRVNAGFSRGLDVAINVIGIPHKKFKYVVDNVFVEDLPLISLKVMFCKTLYIPLISHVCLLYNVSLQELVWADSPYDGAECTRTIRSKPEQELFAAVYNQVNPFILLCWQCENLRRLAIHGYWVWQYDILGCLRLRRSLQLEVSSFYVNQDRFRSRSPDAECVLRVMHYDIPPVIDIREMSNFAEIDWRPITWHHLHPALKANGTPEHRAEYIANEVLETLDVT